jgi:hypothetical protein
MNSKENSYETVTPTVALEAIREYRREADSQLPIKVQSSIYRALFLDIAHHYPNSAPADFRYLLDRLISEGESFCFERLPVLGKAFEVSLISLEPLKVPNGWKFCRGTRLPKFLFELFSQLFQDDGLPRYTIQSKDQYNMTNVNACRFLRQVLMMWSKVIPSGDMTDLCKGSTAPGLEQIKVADALKDFAVRAERITVIENNDPFNKSFLSEARRLISCVLSEHGAKPVPALADFIVNPWGRHGPGAVAGREVGCEKWVFATWPGLPRNLFSWNSKYECEYAGRHILMCQPDARVVAVPKDFRGPRVICIEPKENQFAQQGIMDILYGLITHHPLTRNSIDFFETEENRSLCYNNAYATIDLKDASDNLSLALGKILFPRWFFSLVTRYRSRHVIVRSHRDGVKRVKTTCLATMGNATCFPLETLVFWAIALGTLITVRDSFSKAQQAKMPIKLRVFGDDIIVPLWGADAVCSALETCGLVVNTAKSCTFTPVRESCGEWVFMGKPVRIFRFRTSSVSDHSSYLHWRDHLKDLKQDDMPALQAACAELVEAYFKPTKFRFNKKLQRMEAHVPTFVQRGQRAELPGYTGLYAWHVQGDRTPFLKGCRKTVKMRWQDCATL